MRSSCGDGLSVVDLFWMRALRRPGDAHLPRSRRGGSPATADALAALDHSVGAAETSCPRIISVQTDGRSGSPPTSAERRLS